MAVRTHLGRRLTTIGIGAGITGSMVLGLALWGPPGVSRAFGTGGATRTWVEGIGDDANPCSRTAPCKTFAGAISKTAAGGEIDAIDAGGYGGVTITKAITIAGVGTNASILTSGTAGIIVNAGAGDDVIIRNVSLIGGAQCDGTQVAGSVHGIRYLAGRSLHLQNVDISQYPNAGVSLEPSGTLAYPVSVLMEGVTSRNNCGAGLKSAAGSSTITTTISGSHFDHNQNGIRNTAGAVTVADSTLSGNTGTGVLIGGGGGVKQEVSLTGCAVSGNVTGLQSDSGGSAHVGTSSIDNNGTAFVTNGTGTIASYGDNTASGNDSLGATPGSASHI
jgi:hypothetical protein